MASCDILKLTKLFLVEVSFNRNAITRISLKIKQLKHALNSKCEKGTRTCRMRRIGSFLMELKKSRDQ